MLVKSIPMSSDHAATILNDLLDVFQAMFELIPLKSCTL